MASDPTSTAAPTTIQSSPEKEWTPTDYEQALAHLEALQSQIDNLRSTIPSLVAPLIRPQSNPNLSGSEKKSRTLIGVRKAAGAASVDLKAFGEAWRSERTVEVLGRARESERSDGDLTRAGEVAKWGWEAKVAGEDEEDGMEYWEERSAEGEEDDAT